MNAPLTLSTLTFAMQGGAAVTMFAMARAPGWRQVRIVGALALTASFYALVNLIGQLSGPSEPSFAWVTEVNLCVAAAHVMIWLWYSYSDSRGSWGHLPPWVRRVGVGNLVFSVLVAVSGQAVDLTDGVFVSVPSLGAQFSFPRLTLLGSLAAAATVSLIVPSFWRQLGRMRRGESGSRAIVTGFALFWILAIEETLVAAAVVDFIFLAELGYLALVIPVTAEVLDRFVRDAETLSQMRTELTNEADVATHERDAAREALVAQERFAALGRIASGIGQEINNPLQYLSLSLEELRDVYLADATPDVVESIEQSFEATDRIRRIVGGLRSYANAGQQQLERLDPRALVEASLRVAGAQLRTVPDVRVSLGSTPYVLGDEGKLVQAIVNALVNAAIAAATQGVESPRIEVSTRTGAQGEAVIEVRDNGPGYPTQIVSRLGEPFVTTRATSGGSGLGIFFTRGIVGALGGRLEMENASEGGAVLRIKLPAA